MPEIECGGRSRPDGLPWEALSAELFRCHIRMGTNMLEYWRSVTEIHATTILAITFAHETPTDRRRKFRLIEGGKRQRRAS